MLFVLVVAVLPLIVIGVFKRPEAMEDLRQWRKLGFDSPLSSVSGSSKGMNLAEDFEEKIREKNIKNDTPMTKV